MVAHMGDETVAKCSAAGSAPMVRWRASLADAVVRKAGRCGGVRRSPARGCGDVASCGGMGDLGTEAAAAWLGQGKENAMATVI